MYIYIYLEKSSKSPTSKSLQSNIIGYVCIYIYIMQYIYIYNMQYIYNISYIHSGHNDNNIQWGQHRIHLRLWVKTINGSRMVPGWYPKSQPGFMDGYSCSHMVRFIGFDPSSYTPSISKYRQILESTCYPLDLGYCRYEYNEF